MTRDPPQMTFDQLQRYRLTAELITFLREKKPLLILDAGSREGFLRDFLPEDLIINLDRASFPINNFIQGDVLNLPFSDKSLDISLSLDVLEHIPSSRRIHFLSELARVSRDIVIIGAPFQDEKVEEAERLVNEFCLKVTGKENDFLVDHLTEGLPQMEDVLRWAKERRYQNVVLPNTYLYRWVMMMCLNSYLARLAEPWDLIFAANSFYHQRFYELDNTPPGYHRIGVFSKSGRMDTEEIRKRFVRVAGEEKGAVDFSSFMIEIAGVIESEKDEAIKKLSREKEKEVKKLTGIIDEKTGTNDELRKKLDSEVAKLTGIIDEKSAEIIELCQKADQLQAESRELEGIKSTMAYRFYQKTLGKLRKAPSEKKA